jgi:mono/diheme cytochrome c family protein
MKGFAIAALIALSPAAAAQGADDPAPSQPGSTQPGSTQSKPAAETAAFDVNQLFASSCGWCHSKGGREAGKGPQLMGTSLTDSELISRIKIGKVGQMPGFASSFSDEQIRAIVLYIRDLKPAGP